ncbi:MAG: hypothetical protein ACRDZR_15000, partial [Acidimicrobiales bacterium]
AGATAGAGAGQPVPYQYVAKAYTELLGRAPRPAEWSAAVAYFRRTGCSVATLRRFGEALVGSAEYRRDYPVGGAAGGGDAAAVVLTLYRFVLNREPDPAGFVAARDAIEAGTAGPRAVAGRLFDSAEFAGMTAPAICNPSSPGYFFGQPGNWTAYPAAQTPSRGSPGPDATEAGLQASLDAASADGGGVVALPRREVTGLTTTLVVPGNVTLTTAGDPDPDRYAQMARLARLPGFSGLPGYPGMELVRLQPGARLVHVWVDGQRDAPDPNSFLVFDVRMLGGHGTTVADDRLGNTYGASTLEDDGASAGVPGGAPCRANVVSDNLVEAYSSAHVDQPGQPGTDHPQADGLGIYCTHTQVRGNDIVDVSDTAVALFDGASGLASTPPQLSDVSHNVIVSAGSSYSFGIVTDPSYSLHDGLYPGGDPPGVVSRRFSAGGRSTTISDNVLWSGDRTHFDVLLSSGTHDLFGSTVHQNCSIPNATDQATCGGGRNATAARWTGNTSDGLPVHVEIGLYVGGTTGTVATGNRFPHLVEVDGGTCPAHPEVVAAGFAPGTHIPGHPFLDTALASDSCVNPRF